MLDTFRKSQLAHKDQFYDVVNQSFEIININNSNSLVVSKIPMLMIENLQIMSRRVVIVCSVREFKVKV